MGQNKFSLWFIIAVSLFSICSSVIADDEESDRLSLKGLKGICVRVIITVEETEEFKKRGLYEETIRTDIELKLRMAGVNVVSIDELNKNPGKPLLVVSLAGLPVATRKDTGDKYMAFGVTITFFQDVLLSKNTTEIGKPKIY